jgi:hypothetical protein
LTIYLFTQMKEEHDEHMILFLQCLRENKLYGKLSNCSFYQTKIHYLGHIISKEGIVVNPTKVKAIMRFPSSTSMQ